MDNPPAVPDVAPPTVPVPVVPEVQRAEPAERREVARPVRQERPAAARAQAPRVIRPAGAPLATQLAAPVSPLAIPRDAPVLIAASGRYAPGMTMGPGELEAFVDGVVADRMKRDQIVGATVSVVQNGGILLTKGYGYASLSPARPVDPNTTLFRLASISKTFTWIMVLRAAEQGQLRLDRPVNVYLPEKIQVRDQGFKTPVTLQHLLNHTGGFDDTAAGHLFERLASRERPLERYLGAERPRRVREPGKLITYSNFGSGLAGAALANVKGTPFEQLAETEIFRPLNMGRTTFREPRAVTAGLPQPMSADLAADLSKGYLSTPEGPRPQAFEYIGHVAPAGSASSTATDMARYMLMMLAGGYGNGNQIYGPQTAALLRPGQQALADAMHPYRNGFMVERMPGGMPSLGHSGATLTFMSKLVIVPDLNLGIFISTNTSSGAGLSEGLADAVVERFYVARETSPLQPDPALYKERAAYEGLYRGSRRPSLGLEAFVMSLLADHRVRISKDGMMTLETAEGLSRFVSVPGSNGTRFQSLDSSRQMTVVRQNGRVVQIVAPPGFQTLLRTPLVGSNLVLIIMSGLAALAALSTIAGLFNRMSNPAGQRQSDTQALANGLQVLQAILILVGLGCFLTWSITLGTPQGVMFNWPGATLLTASASLLITGLLSLVGLGVTPLTWRSERRVDSWRPMRKVRFTITTVIFALFSALLAYRGALMPWT